MSTIIAGQLVISTTERPVVIAECCNNFQNSLEVAKHMVTVARECGADAVKFQYRKLPGRIGLYQLGELRALAHAVGLEFLCTAYTRESRAEIDPLVVAHKVGAAEVADAGHVAHAASFGKPVLVSTGGMDLASIVADETMRSLQPIIPLQCTSIYPCPLNHAHLGVMSRLHVLRAGGPVGYSDHTGTLEAPVAALTLGANVIEVHFTLSKALPGPDQACSHEPEQLRRICDFARQRAAVLDASKEFLAEEHEKLDLFRKIEPAPPAGP